MMNEQADSLPTEKLQISQGVDDLQPAINDSADGCRPGQTIKRRINKHILFGANYNREQL
jgi:hypothetical protein